MLLLLLLSHYYLSIGDCLSKIKDFGFCSVSLLQSPSPSSFFSFLICTVVVVVVKASVVVDDDDEEEFGVVVSSVGF